MPSHAHCSQVPCYRTIRPPLGRSAVNGYPSLHVMSRHRAEIVVSQASSVRTMSLYATMEVCSCFLVYVADISHVARLLGRTCARFKSVRGDSYSPMQFPSQSCRKFVGECTHVISPSCPHFTAPTTAMSIVSLSRFCHLLTGDVGRLLNVVAGVELNSHGE